MTYATLVQLMKDYLENQEASFVSNIPDIVRLVEERIYNTVRTPDQRQSVTGTTATATITTPGSFVEPLGLYVNSVPLLPKAVSYIRTAYSGITGQPEAYAMLNAIADSPNENAPATILIGPAPSTTYSYTLDYVGAPTSITVAATPSRTTWLSANFSSVLLYGCLIEGYVYNKGQADMMAEYRAQYEAGMKELKRSAEGLLQQDEYRDRPLGREVTL